MHSEGQLKDTLFLPAVTQSPSCRCRRPRHLRGECRSVPHDKGSLVEAEGILYKGSVFVHSIGLAWYIYLCN
jgi:hypothetical protein